MSLRGRVAEGIGMTLRILALCCLVSLVAACGGRQATSDVVPAALDPIGEIEGSRVGTWIGPTLSSREQGVAIAAEYQALEYGRNGQITRWQSDQTDARGEISVGSSYQVNRLDCREYTHRIFIGGRAQVARGTACRQPSGLWRIVS